MDKGREQEGKREGGEREHMATKTYTNYTVHYTLIPRVTVWWVLASIASSIV